MLDQNKSWNYLNLYWVLVMLMTENVTIDIIEKENDEDTLTKVRRAGLAGAGDHKMLKGL